MNPILQQLAGRNGQQPPIDPSRIGPSLGPPQSGGISTGGRIMPMDAIRRRIAQMGGGEGLGGTGIAAQNALMTGAGGSTPVTEPPRQLSERGPVGDNNLLGIPDARGMAGILSRGANVYNAGAPQAHSGGGSQFGRPPVGIGQEGGLPPRNAVLRRIMAQKGNNSGIAIS